MKSFKSFCIEDCGCKYYKKSKKQKQVEEAFLSNKGKSFAKHLAIGAMAGAIPLAATLAGHTQKEKPTTIGNRVVSQVSPAPKPQAQPESQHTDLSHGLIKHFHTSAKMPKFLKLEAVPGETLSTCKARVLLSDAQTPPQDSSTSAKKKA